MYLSLSHSFSLTILNPWAPSIPIPHFSNPSASHHSRVNNYLNQESLKLQSKGVEICLRYFAVFSAHISPDSSSLVIISIITICNPVLSLYDTSEHTG
jgi:hypothetical protein